MSQFNFYAIFTNTSGRDVYVGRWDFNTPIAVSPTIRIADKYAVDALRGFLVRKVRED